MTREKKKNTADLREAEWLFWSILQIKHRWRFDFSNSGQMNIPTPVDKVLGGRPCSTNFRQDRHILSEAMVDRSV